MTDTQEWYLRSIVQTETRREEERKSREVLNDGKAEMLSPYSEPSGYYWELMDEVIYARCEVRRYVCGWDESGPRVELSGRIAWLEECLPLMLLVLQVHLATEDVGARDPNRR